MVLHIELPFVLAKPVSDLASLCTPLALVALGGFFDFKKLRGNVKQIVIGSVGKLLIVPAIFIGIAILLGFRDNALAALFALYATPTAITSFTMAQIMEGDTDLAAQLVIVQSCLSIVTMFLWVFALHAAGLM